MSGALAEADDWLAPAEPPSAPAAAAPADDWTPTLEPGQHDYTKMGFVDRGNDQLASGWEGAKQGVNMLGLAGGTNSLRALDQAEAAPEDPASPLLGTPAAKIQEMRQATLGDVGQRVANITDSQGRQQLLATNPAHHAMSEQINAGKYGDAWRTFKSDPFGIIQQVSVESLPSMIPTAVAGMAAAATGAGAVPVALASAAGSYAADLGPRGLGYLQDGLREIGVDPTDGAAVSAAIRAHPELVKHAMDRASVASIGPAAADAVTGGITRGFRPAMGFGHNARVLAGNTLKHAAGEPAGEAAGQLLGGGIDDPAGIVDEFLGSAPHTALHTGETALREYRSGALRPGGPRPGPSIDLGLAGTGPTTPPAAPALIASDAPFAEPPAPPAPPPPQSPPPTPPTPAPAPAPPVRDVQTKRQELYDILSDPRPTSEIRDEINARPVSEEGRSRAQDVQGWVEKVAEITTNGEPHPASQAGAEIAVLRSKLMAAEGQEGGPTPAQIQAAAPGAEPTATTGGRADPIAAAHPTDIEVAAGRVNDAPSEAQSAAGNYRKGHLKVGGLDIAIETPAGAERKGVAPDGTAWSVQMPADYGYIKRTTGADGDQVDVYLGPQAHEAAAHPVFVVDQIDPATGKFDEHKAMLGFPNEATARAAYHAAFSDSSGARRAGAVTEMAFPQFKRWATAGNTDKPLAYKPPSKAKPRPSKPGKPPTLLQFLAARGGLLDQGGDLRAMDAHRKFIPRHGMLVRATGMKLDMAREAAEEAGFLRPNSTTADLLSAVAEEMSGRQVFRPEDAEDARLTDEQPHVEYRNDEHDQHQADIREVADHFGIAMTPDEVFEAAGAMIEYAGSHEQAIYDVLQKHSDAHNDELAAMAANRGDPIWDVPYFDPEEIGNGAFAVADAADEGRAAARTDDGPARDGKPPGGEPGPRVVTAGSAPGGEGPAIVPRPAAPAGQGGLLPGFAPVTDGERAQAGSDRALQGGTRPVEGGLWTAAEGHQTDLVDAVKATGPDYGNIAKPNVPGLGKAFADAFASGTAFASIAQARTFASKLLGTAVQPGTMAAKMVDEAVELGVVLQARKLADGKDEGASYDALVKLYAQQPTVGTRTSDSVERQAYSTPAPLAYLASRLAGIDTSKTVLEPTAGNGALLIQADPAKSTTNELDPTRLEALRAQGFKPTEQDATLLQVAPKSQDVVIANPPFGILRDENGQTTEYDLHAIQPNYTTGEIDHAIALRSLAAMKDSGRAVLLLGGVNKLVSTPKGRADAYNGKAKRLFFYTLYGKYNVVDHFTVRGELYQKQGAGWPVDVIVVDGRGKSGLPLPSVTSPRIVPTWDALKEVLTDGKRLADQNAQDGLGTAGQPATVVGSPGAKRPQNRPDVPAIPGTPRAPGRVDDRTIGEPATSDGGSGGRDGGGRGVVGAADVPDPMGGRDQLDAGQPGIPGRPEPDGGVAGREPVPGAEAPGGRSGDAGDVAERVDRPGVPGDDGRPGGGVASAFDEAFADVFGKNPPISGEKPSQNPVSDAVEKSVPAKSAGQAAASAAVNALSAADDAMAGLAALFGAKDRLGSGPSFDEQTWAKAKPMFQTALAKFKAAGADIKAMLVALMTELRDAYRLSARAIQEMRPYLERFAREWTPEETAPTAVARQEDSKSPTPAPRPREQETATQVAYEPASKIRSVGTLVPTNMRTAVAEAMQTLESDVGPIDAYVADRLGYDQSDLERFFSAEQVDALGLGIRQIDQGKGFIIGDQTGVGKGRFVAGLIRYAMRQNLVPVFVTEKPNLYGDMVRDLTDIGMPEMADQVLVTNGGLNLPLSDDPKGLRLKTPPAAEHDKAMQAAASSGRLPDRYKAMFTTYSQMQQIGGMDTPRMRVLNQVAPNAFLILDEAHNAGGTPDTGRTVAPKPGKPAPVPRSKFFRSIVNQARSVAYSSATWAKRPDVLDLYGAKTDMREAVDDLKQLADAIKKGGVPMQQIVTAQLASVGQYTRRERSFAGVTYDIQPIETDRQAYDKIAGVLARIFEISEDHARPAVKEIGNSIRDAAAAVGGDGAVGSAGATSTGFGSIMHNLINQMLLASKAKGTVDEAIAALKAGEKPVIAVANTMGSFIQEFAEMAGAKPDDAIDLTFNQLLKRYLARNLRYTTRKPFMEAGEKAEVHHLSVDDLGIDGARLYRQTEAAINALDLGTMPVSPIDYMRSELTKAGYKVAEITGRTEAADYRGDGRVYYRKRSTKETSPAGRMNAISSFNSGDVDVMILNQSGATGLSLHASEKVKDQRKRRMLIAQAEANIDTHMQMLGRVHRTGQVVVPGYKQLVANVPAEQRPAAVLANKMASLSASTTANRKGGIGAENAPDFINKYGGQIIQQLLNEDPDLDKKLGRPTGNKEDDDEGGKDQEAESMEGLARKVTGRIPLLPLAEQEALYAEIEGRYAALIQQLDEAGENGLEAKTLDLDARTLSTSTLTEGKGNSPFTSAATLEQVDVKRSFTPASMESIAADLARGLGSAGRDQDASGTKMTADEAAAAMTTMLASHAGDAVDQAIRQVEAGTREAVKQTGSKIKDADRRAAHVTKLEASADRIKATIREAEPGSLVDIATEGELLTERALVTRVRLAGKSVTAPSAWEVEVVTSAGMRRRISMSSLFTDETKPQSDAPEGTQTITAVPAQNTNLAVFLQGISDEASGVREERSMVTGNILAGYAAVNSEGQIVNYTDHTGATRQGVLLPKKWNAQDFAAKQAQGFNPTSALQWLMHGGDTTAPAEVHTRGNELRIARDDKGGFVLTTAASKADGGAYFLDQGIRTTAGGLVKSGDRMRANVPAWRLPDLLAAVGKVMGQQKQRLVSDHPQAKDWVKQAKDSGASYRDTPAGWGEVDPGPEQMGPGAQEQRAIVEAAQKIVGPSVGIDVIDGTMTVTRPDGSKADIGGLSLGRLIIVATGPKMAWNAAHEAVHALRNLGVISSSEWKTLEAAAKREGWIDADAGRSSRYRDDQKIEEAIAEQFGRWSTTEKPPAGMIGRAWAKVRRFVEALRNALAGRGFRTAEGVFEGIASGNVGGREPGSRARPMRYGDETMEDGRQRVLAHLVDTGFLESALRDPVAKLMASLSEHRDPSEAAPETLAGRLKLKVANAPVIGAAAIAAGTHLTDVAHTIQMMLAPMAHGGATDEARALAKDFANAKRLVRWAGNRAMDELGQRFTTDQLARMWTAADKESVARQTGSTTRDGLNTLEPEERAEVEELQARAAKVYEQARKVGIHQNENPLPSYVPRMVVDIAMQDEGKAAHVVRDIRTLVLATMRLQEAIIGRQLINQVKAVGQRSGMSTVHEGSPGASAMDGLSGIRVTTPQMRRRKNLETEGTEAAAQRIRGEDGFSWFTIPQSSAFWTSKFKGRSADGEPIFERVPIYVRGDFEGPLRAVLRKPDGKLYRAAMDLKGRMMTSIMYGVAHLGVISARTVPYSPNVIGAIREGALVRQDVATMRRAIANGLAPMGKRGGFQDAAGIEAEQDPKPGRSWTSQILAAVPNMVSPKAGDAVKRGVDKLGDISHGWMWNQIANIQAGVFVRIERKLTAEGMAPDVAAKLAARDANLAAGAVPEEAMSQATQKFANMVLFSRSYRLGNAAAIKDAFTGLPRDIQAQIRRDHGDVIMRSARNRARRFAVAALIIDLSLASVGNSLLQSSLHVLSGRHTLSQELQGYVDRAVREGKHLVASPASALNPFGVLHSLTPMEENEPGKGNRLMIGYEKDGTAIYLRNPLGKYAEDVIDYFTQPIKTLHSMMSPYMHAVDGAWSNKNGFGRPIYDPYVDTPGRLMRALGDYAAYVIEGAGPSTAVKAATRLITGESRRPGFDIAQIVGGGAGMSFSHGFAGGPIRGEMQVARDQHGFDVGRALPAIREKMQLGKTAEAVTELRKLGVPQGLMRYYLMQAVNPAASPDQVRKTLEYASPEQRERILRQIRRPEPSAPSP